MYLESYPCTYVRIIQAVLYVCMELCNVMYVLTFKTQTDPDRPRQTYLGRRELSSFSRCSCFALSARSALLCPALPTPHLLSCLPLTCPTELPPVQTLAVALALGILFAGRYARLRLLLHLGIFWSHLFQLVCVCACVSVSICVSVHVSLSPPSRRLAVLVLAEQPRATKVRQPLSACHLLPLFFLTYLRLRESANERQTRGERAREFPSPPSILDPIYSNLSSSSPTSID